jgi:hypothetical protein
METFGRSSAATSVVTFFESLRRSLTRDDPSAFAAPAQFGPFRVLHQIGVGALGPVFRTYEPNRDRLVAVKVFRLDLTPEQAQSLADELSRAAEAGLFHPSIVEPIAAGIEGSVAYGAEEYVAAESLDVAMRHYAPASIETVLPFITQLAGAIDFARAAGVGHGALHPRDIFMSPEEARATGFGVVEALERVGFRAPVRRPYSPPERIAGEPWGTPADVFSLAAITYELLTGRRPAGIGQEIGPLTAGTPNNWMEALHAVLARAMSEHPSDRYPTALGFAAALEGAAHGVTASNRDGTESARSAPDEAHTRTVPAVAPAIPEAAAAPAAASALTAGLDGSQQDLGTADARLEPLHKKEQEEVEQKIEQEEEEVSAQAADISGERDEDEAYHQLTLREAAAAEPDRFEEALADDIAAETEADRFMLDVAGVAAAAPRDASFDDLPRSTMPVDVRGFQDEEAPRGLLHDREQAAAPHPSFGYAAPPQEPTVDEESRSRWLVPLVLVFGLLAGFAGGYAIWGRSSGAPAGSPGATAASPSTGREVTEQAVAPRPGTSASPSPPERSGSTAKPPAPSPPAGSSPAPAAAPTPAPAARTGRLEVRSTPSGAGVTVNGTWRGRTPLTLDELAFARYQVRVIQAGYVTESEAVALSADRPSRTLSFRLRQQARSAPRAENQPPGAPPAAAKPPAAARGQSFTGSIYVDSRPRGARVSLNGKPVGVTPLRIADVRIGAHVVRLELPDYRIWSSSARVSAGQEARVTGSLERIQ